MSDSKPTPPRITKELKASRKVRLAQVLDWMVGCIPTGEIEKLGAAKYKVTTRTIRKDIAHCRHKILPTWFEWTEKRVMAAELLAKLELLDALLERGDLGRVRRRACAQRLDRILARELSHRCRLCVGTPRLSCSDLGRIRIECSNATYVRENAL